MQLSFDHQIHLANSNTNKCLPMGFVALLMNSVVSVQVTESHTNVMPVLLDVLCHTAHIPVHTDVV